jgi:hypothetical protein
MSRKHFIALAQALASERPADHWDANKRAQWDLDCAAIARTCAYFNPNFNTTRFLLACQGALSYSK